jgi:dienelactone hydrolase
MNDPDRVARRGDQAPPRYDPLRWLSRQLDEHKLELPFPAGKPAQAAAWRRKLLKELGARLGFRQYKAAAFKERRLAREEFDTFVREAYEIQTLPGMWTLVYIVLPKGIQGRRPGIVCCTGHGNGANDLVGLHPDGRPRDLMTGYQRDFAIQAAQQGFVAAAHDQIGWGRRQVFDFLKKSPGVHGCWPIALRAIQFGMSLPGLRAFESIRVAEFLRSRPEVNPDRIGITGISSGGNICLFTAAMHQRFQAVVLSGYFCTFRDSILAVHHCMDHYVPGLSRLAEMADVAALIGPAPLLVETGEWDFGFPIAGVRKSFGRLAAAYKTMGAGDRVKLHIFDDGHRWDGAAAWPWFHRFLD